MNRVFLVLKTGFLFLMLFAIISCENGTRAFLESLNEAPVINFANGEDQLIDSIKLASSFKGEEANFYPINFTVTDENDNITRVEYVGSERRGVLLQNGDTISNSISLQGGNMVECQYYPQDLGEHILRFNAVDAFDEIRSIRVNLNVFGNKPPVALFTVRQIGQLSRYQYLIDASGSFDRDNDLGGRIIEYEFGLLGKINRIRRPEFNVIFPEAGTYTMRVRVRDSDGIWSESVEETISVR